MAENKKSFILYADLIHTVSKMPNDKAGELFKHILKYVNDEEPSTDDLIVELSFEPIKQQLKRDLQKYEGVRESKSNSGLLGNLKRWNKDLYKQVIEKVITIEDAIIIAKDRTASQEVADGRTVSQTIANVAVNVNDNVNDNVNVTDNVKESNAHALSKSNLFRSPVIPKIEEVNQAFLSAGGTKEMASAFFEKNNSVGWFLRGSPIVNFKNLLPSFITNWNNNLKNGSKSNNNSAERTWDARVAHANRYSEESPAGNTDP